jgi:hypothetical protein
MHICLLHQNQCRLNKYFPLSLLYIYPIYFLYRLKKISDSLSIYQVN